MPRLFSFFEDPIAKSKFSMARLVMFLFTLTACALASGIVYFAFKHDAQALTITALGGVVATLVTGGVIGIYGRSRVQTIDCADPTPTPQPSAPPPPTFLPPGGQQ